MESILKRLNEVEAVECDAGRDPGASKAAAVRAMSDHDLGEIIHAARMYQPNRVYWHWTGERTDVPRGEPLPCGVPFMSPQGGLCSVRREGVDCPECLKILQAPTNTLRLAEIGSALEAALSAYDWPLTIERVGEAWEVAAIDLKARDTDLARALWEVAGRVSQEKGKEAWR